MSDAIQDLARFTVEVRRKIYPALAVFVFGILVTFFLAEYLILNFQKNFVSEEIKLVSYTPLEYFMLKVKVSLYGGIIFLTIYGAFILKKTFKFRIKKSSFLVYSATAIFLFSLGAFSAYIFFVPLMVKILTSGIVSADLLPLYSVSQFVMFVFLFILAFGITFEFPLIIVLLVRAGIVSVTTLKKRRREAWVGAFILSALITDPTPTSQILVAFPIIFFYEISIFFARFVGKKKI